MRTFLLSLFLICSLHDAHAASIMKNVSQSSSSCSNLSSKWSTNLAELSLGERKAIHAALVFAKKYHAENKPRKYDGQPYTTHPIRVAKTVMEVTKDPDLTVAAILHDTLEDTRATYSLIKRQFGKKIADLVLQLSNNPAQLERLGKTEYLKQKMLSMSLDALIIKLADRLDNVSDFHFVFDRNLPPELRAKVKKFADKYEPQTRDIMTALMERRDLTSSHQQLIQTIVSKLNQHTATEAQLQ